MKFAKLVESWHGGREFWTLQAFYFPDRVECQLFIEGKAQIGCNWIKTHNDFSRMIDEGDWKQVSETKSDELLCMEMRAA